MTTPITSRAGKRRVRRPWRRFRARPHCSSVWQSRVGRGQRARARSALMRSWRSYPAGAASSSQHRWPHAASGATSAPRTRPGKTSRSPSGQSTSPGGRRKWRRRGWCRMVRWGWSMLRWIRSWRVTLPGRRLTACFLSSSRSGAYRRGGCWRQPRRGGSRLTGGSWRGGPRRGRHARLSRPANGTGCWAKWISRETRCATTLDTSPSATGAGAATSSGTRRGMGLGRP
mmetsp:Transcript_14242/g.32947  ORF Transcript_14242/g.32947 Transcript_14242/m.32947 type:complete len:229 (+) Transcript_14242:765-1451(+)